MNKRELVELIAKKSNMTKYSVEKVFTNAKEIFVEVLSKGGEINIKDFGKFEAKQSQERLFRNPITKKLFYAGGKKYLTLKLFKNFKYSIK